MNENPKVPTAELNLKNRLEELALDHKWPDKTNKLFEGNENMLEVVAIMFLFRITNKECTCHIHMKQSPSMNGCNNHKSFY